MSFYHRARFSLSAAKVSQLPFDEGIEVAIVGRSNAGKSSVLNALTRQQQLARVSKTPGRTQLINVFILDDYRRLMDLPGYGFAKVALSVKKKWEETINQYIVEREALKGLVLVMDIRHPMQPLDLQLLSYCASRQLPVHILLNKCDKLSYGAAKNTLKQVTSALSTYSAPITVQIFSASKHTGIEHLKKILNQWYSFNT